MTSTISKQSRHLACVLCRDRKVKCDGGRPSCKKCTKAGEICTYSVNPKTPRAELEDTIQRLNKRIEQAEANQATFMAQQQWMANCTCRLPVSFDTPFPEHLAMIDQQRQQQQQHPAENRQTNFASSHGHSSSFGALPASRSLQNSAEDSTFHLNVRPAQCHFFALGSGHAETELTGSMKTPTRLTADVTSSEMISEPDYTAHKDLSPCSRGVVDDNYGSNAAISSTVPLADPAWSNYPQLPSLQDVREWSWRTSSGQDCGGVGVAGDDHYSDEDKVGRLLREFITLGCATESAQYNIIGVAKTAAMYSSYFRRASLDGKENIEGLMKFLETLEHRMREISEIASQQVLGQTRKSREVVKEYDTYRDRIKEVEDGQRHHMQALSDFFRTRYDLSNPMSQQV